MKGPGSARPAVETTWCERYPALPLGSSPPGIRPGIVTAWSAGLSCPGPGPRCPPASSSRSSSDMEAPERASRPGPGCPRGRLAVQDLVDGRDDDLGGAVD